VIKVNGEAVRVDVVVSRRARKTVSIMVKSRSRLEVRVPEGCDVDVGLLLEKFRPRIEEKHRAYMALKPLYGDGWVLFNGTPRKIKAIPSKANKVVLTGGEVHIEHLEDFEPVKVFKKWCTEQTRHLFEEVKAKHPSLEAPVRVSVADTARWGYTRGRVVVLNWLLCALPRGLAEYVIVHELVHLEHSNHENGFYTRLKALVPDYKEKNKTLKQYKPVKNNKFDVFRKLS